MAGQDDVDGHGGGAFDDGIEVVHFKPEQDAVAVRLVGGIADAAVVMLDLEAVQLQDEVTTVNQLFIMAAAVS